MKTILWKQGYKNKSVPGIYKIIRIILNDNNAVIFVSTWKYLLRSFFHIINFTIPRNDFVLTQHFLFCYSFSFVWVMVLPCVGFAWECFCNSDFYETDTLSTALTRHLVIQIFRLVYFLPPFVILWLGLKYLKWFFSSTARMILSESNQWCIIKKEIKKKPSFVSYKSNMMIIVKF